MESLFTGIIESIGKVRAVRRSSGGADLVVSIPAGWKMRVGESVSVNGVCLSAQGSGRGHATFHCIPETLRRTDLGNLKAGDPVNLERPLTLQKLAGGHWVQGHADGAGVIRSSRRDGRSRILRIGSLRGLARFFVEKGSVAVDGVSLTILEAFQDGFSVGLIPVTCRDTVLGRKKAGDKVNIEVDMMVKIVEKLLRTRKTR